MYITILSDQCQNDNECNGCNGCNINSIWCITENAINDN